MQIHYINYILDATLGAQNIPQYQLLASLQEPHLTSTFYQVNSSPDPYITIDLGSAKSIRSCIIDIGNLLATTTVTLYGTTDPTYSTANVTHSMTYHTSCFDYVGASSESYRYWKIKLHDHTLTTIRFGYIFIGDYITMPAVTPNSTIKYNTTGSRDLSISMNVYGDRGLNYNSYTLSFPYISDTAWTNEGVSIATRQQIVDWFYVVGMIQPFWLFIWQSNLSIHAPVFSVVDQSSLEFVRQEGFYTTQIAFVEVK